MDKKYLTVKQVEEVYGINRNALYELFREGKLSKFKLNGTKISVEELDKYAESVREGVDGSIK